MNQENEGLIPVSSSINRIIKQNIGPLIIAQIITFGINFAQMVYLARVLAPDNFGVMNYFLNILAFLQIFTTQGISTMGTRELAMKGTYNPSLYWNITILRLVLCVISIFGAGIWFLIINREISLTIIFLIYLCSLIPLAINPDWVFNGLELMKINGISKFFIAITGIALVFFFVHAPSDLFFVPVAYCISLSAGPIFGIYYLYKAYKGIGFALNPSIWPEYLKKSVNLGIVSYLTMAIASIDLIFIGTLLTPSDVGYYSGASKLILAIHTLLSLVVIGIFPAVIRTMSNNPGIIPKISSKIITNLLFFELFICLIVSMNADILIPVIYGTGYLPTVPVMQILIWSIIPYSLFLVYSVILNASFRESLVTRILTIQMILLIPVMIIGTYFFGITGTAWSILLVGIGVFLMYAFIYKNEIVFPAWNAFILIGIAGTAILVRHGIDWYDMVFQEPFFSRIIAVILFVGCAILFRLVSITALGDLIRKA